VKFKVGERVWRCAVPAEAHIDDRSGKVKIVVITDDERTISQHFGRAPYYLVATVDDGQVIEWQRRDKLGHAQRRRM